MRGAQPLNIVKKMATSRRDFWTARRRSRRHQQRRERI